jgi:hypothetical protein
MHQLGRILISLMFFRVDGQSRLGVYLAGESTAAIDMVWYRDPAWPGMAPLSVVVFL